MRKLITFSLLLFALVVDARQISRDEAAVIAAEFLTSDKVQQSLPSGPVQAPSLKATDANAAQPYYVFNADGDRGFVIVSGDDRARRVLGYSDHGSFDFDNLPPQLAAMLEQYAEQIKALPASTSTDPSWSAPSDAPASNDGVLLETANWGQGYPYNAKCPIIDGVQAPTGCVATAMAIVMKYHNWPEKSRSFNLIQEGDEDIMIDFDQYSFSYDKMPLTYDKDTEKTYTEEVSNFMFVVGRSVHMNYGPLESGAYFQIVSHELQEKFSYSPECHFLMGCDYSWDEWINIVVNEIDNKRPILYAGVSSNNFDKHAFVCDGYNKDGFFHINWGWSGIDNGYFILDKTLYSNSPSMIINIQPDKSGKQYARPYTLRDDIYTLFEEADFINVSVPSINQGIKFDIGSPTIRCPYRFNGDLGFALTDINGNIKEVIGTYNIDGGGPYLPYGSGRDFQLYGVSTSESVEKTDRLQLIARESENDEWRLITGCPAIPSSISVEDCNNKMINVLISCDPQIIMKRHYQGLTIPITESSFSQLFGSHVQLWAHLKNSNLNGYGIITINGKGAYSDIYNFLVSPGGEVGFAFRGIDDYVINGKYYEYSAPLTLTVLEAGTLTNLININEAHKVGDLTIKGNINAYDLWFIRENMKGLRRLDLSESTIKGVNTPGVIINSIGVSEYQYDDAMPDWALEGLSLLNEVILPSNLKFLMNSSLSGLNISNITLPATIEDFGYNNFFVCSNLDEIVNLNSTPVPIRECNFTGTKCPELATLLVPEESISDYKNAPVWKDFKNIYPIGTPAESITLSQETATLKVGHSIKLSATVLPEVADKTVEWTSNAPEVAVVDTEGKVTAVSIGEAVITATAADGSGVSANCTVTVEPILVYSLSITPERWDGIEGERFSITAIVLPESATNKSLSWSSSNPEIATVDADGNVTVLKDRYCTIEVSTLDGSNLVAKCFVVSRSGIAEIFVDKEANIDVYLPNGVMVKHNCTIDEAQSLVPGIYIIRCGNNVKTVYIRN